MGCLDRLDSFDYSDRGFIVKSAALSLLTFAILFGNTLVILAVLTSRQLRSSVTSFLILSLAVADISVGALIMPFSTLNEGLGFWIFGDIWCNTWLALDVWMCTSSIYNLVAISIDRLIAIVQPLKYSVLVTPTRGRLMIVSVWLLSFIVCAPNVIRWYVEAYAAGRNSTSQEASTFAPLRINDSNATDDCQCTPMANDRAYTVFSAFSSFFIPMIAIVVIYVRIFSTARAVSKSMTSGFVSMAGKKNMPKASSANSGYLADESDSGLLTRAAVSSTGIGASAMIGGATGQLFQVPHESKPSQSASYARLSNGRVWTPFSPLVSARKSLLSSSTFLSRKHFGRPLMGKMRGSCSTLPTTPTFECRPLQADGDRCRLAMDDAINRKASPTHSSNGSTLAAPTSHPGDGLRIHYGRRVQPPPQDAKRLSVPNSSSQHEGLRIHVGRGSSQHEGLRIHVGGQRKTQAVAEAKLVKQNTDTDMISSLLRKSNKELMVQVAVVNSNALRGRKVDKFVSGMKQRKVTLPSVLRKDAKPKQLDDPQGSSRNGACQNRKKGLWRMAKASSESTTNDDEDSSTLQLASLEQALLDLTAAEAAGDSFAAQRRQTFRGKLSRFMNRSKDPASQLQKRINIEIRAAKTVAIVTGCFICSWLGFAVVYLLNAFCTEPPCTDEVLERVFFWFGYVNSALNPIIYAVFSKQFRTVFKQLLCCRVRTRRERDLREFRELAAAAGRRRVAAQQVPRN